MFPVDFMVLLLWSVWYAAAVVVEVGKEGGEGVGRVGEGERRCGRAGGKGIYSVRAVESRAFDTGVEGVTHRLGGLKRKQTGRRRRGTLAAAGGISANFKPPDCCCGS